PSYGRENSGQPSYGRENSGQNEGSMMRPRIAIVSDTVDDTNGVAFGLRRLVDSATRAGHAVHLVGPANPAVTDSVVRIPAAMTAALPFYADMTWSVPELPPLIMWLAANADLVQVATPGPMGIAALVAARMLGLPLIAQYHTEVAEYAARMTGMPMLGMLVEPIVGWFYKQTDLCLAPSATVERRLASFGVPTDRIVRVRRGVDLELFHPIRRDRGALARYGIEVDTPVALYVGRLSKEKNLEALQAAWQLVHAARPDARLVVVGEGPQPNLVTGPGVIAAGPLFGDQLAAMFASADVFAFPSETETFGNVVVEAAASGLPAVVARAGAAHEHVVDGVTGEVVDAKPPAIATAVLALFADHARRLRMGLAARTHAAGYNLHGAVSATWDIYRDVLRARTVLEAAS
ncbi:MAG: glycosyltransferase family 1 protein, partial [Kofleriaceae bacterium]